MLGCVAGHFGDGVLGTVGEHLGVGTNWGSYVFSSLMRACGLPLIVSSRYQTCKTTNSSRQGICNDKTLLDQPPSYCLGLSPQTHHGHGRDIAPRAEMSRLANGWTASLMAAMALSTHTEPQPVTTSLLQTIHASQDSLLLCTTHPILLQRSLPILSESHNQPMTMPLRPAMSPSFAAISK